MDGFLASLFALAALGLAAYAHWRLPRFVAGGHKLLAVRSVLIAVGIGCGSIGAVLYPRLPGVSFLLGFGAVHFPAAAIVLLKGLRGEGPS